MISFRYLVKHKLKHTHTHAETSKIKADGKMIVNDCELKRNRLISKLIVIDYAQAKIE